jgi:hypothetical protein
MTQVVKRFYKFKSYVNSAEGAERWLSSQTVLTAQTQRPVTFCSDADVIMSKITEKSR